MVIFSFIRSISSYDILILIYLNIELTHGYRYQNKSNEREDFHTYNFDQHSSPSINRPILNVVNNNVDNQDNNYSIPSNESNNLNNETNIQIRKKKKNNKLKSSSSSYRSLTLPSPESFSLHQSRSNNRNFSDNGDISNSRNNDDNNNILVLPVQYTSDTFTTSRYSLPSDHILPLQHGVIVVSSNITLYELVCRLQEQFDLPVEYNITLYTRERKDNSSHKYDNNDSYHNDNNCDDTLHKWNEVPVAIQVFYIIFNIFSVFNTILNFSIIF